MKSVSPLDNPRQSAVNAMKASIPAALWQQNESFLHTVREAITTHPVSTHVAITSLNAGRFGLEAMRKIHLEYRHAIVQVFTDALLIAQHQSRQLEPRQAPGSKIYPRFLMTLNVLDEFGFRPGSGAHGYYQGHPAQAHYPLFERLLDDYGMSAQERGHYVPSPSAQKVRAFLENSFSNYAMVVALLAVAEEEVILFSPPLRRNTAALGIGVNDGYYHVHGASEDKTCHASDDYHENDLWCVLTQALLPADYDNIRSACLAYCDLWDQFWTHQLQLASSDQKAQFKGELAHA